MNDSKIIHFENVIKAKKEKIKLAQRQLFNLKNQQKINRLIIAGRVLEAAGLLDSFDYDATLQVLLTHREECICQNKKN